jgi:membrane-associated protein
MEHLIDLVLHLDEHLKTFVETYGTFTYVVLFLIIFCETGLVVTPFLPGDSLLFAAGAITALGGLNVTLLTILLIIAAILGDSVNYWIGAKIGQRLIERHPRWLKQEYLDRTHAFYAKHGGKTIVLARFVPIVRTFAPFVAGLGSMEYRRFLIYNIGGGIAWVAGFVLAGHFFGNLPFVQRHFEWLIIGIIVVSVVPFFYHGIKHRLERQNRAAPADVGPPM